MLTRLASEVARLGGWELVVASSTVYWDENVADMHGMSGQHRLPREQALEPYVPESRQRFEASLEACITAGRPFDAEFELLRADGGRRWFRAIGRPLADDTGRVVSVHGACQDITALKEARADAESLLQLLQATLEGMSDGFVMLDRDFRVIYLNDIAAADMQRPREALIGRVLWESTPEIRGTRFEAEAIKAMETRTPVVFEDSSNPPGSRWFQVRAFPIPNGGLAIYALDITARKLAEEARRRTEAQMLQAQKMESLGTLAGGIAHDFNNVLGAILGNAGLALDELPAGHPVRHHLERIRHAGQHARNLVQRILTFSRAEGSTPQVAAQSLVPVVNESIHMLRTMLPPSVELRAALAEDELAVEVDSTSVQQVLMNLCTNAWQALPQGRGWVEIGTRRCTLAADEARRISPTLTAGDLAQLWVRDNGRGIEPAARERIFEPFFTTKPHGEGTGLGLPVVHGIVASHRGAIVVTSEPGRGTTFDVYLPLAGCAPAAPRASNGSGRQAPGRGERVMLVDDDPVVLLTAEQILRRLGYSVVTHDDAVVAMDALRQAPGDVDIVVTDFNMPQASGLELAGEARRLRPELPIVINSGFVSDEVQSLVDRGAASAVVHKENLYEEIGQAVADALARAR